MHTVGVPVYRAGVEFSDSSFNASHAAPDEELGWGRVLVLGLVLTLAAMSAGLLAGGVGG